MKGIITIFGCILISTSLFAQSDSVKRAERKLKFGANVSYNITPYVWAAITPSLVLNKGHHSFLIGPRILS